MRTEPFNHYANSMHLIAYDANKGVDSAVLVTEWDILGVDIPVCMLTRMIFIDSLWDFLVVMRKSITHLGRA